MLSVEKLNEICSALPDESREPLQEIFKSIEFESKTLDALRENKAFFKNDKMQKVYMKFSDSLRQNLKLVMWQIRNNEVSSADELLNRLKEFEV